jgi:predicted nucleotide-binding protein
MPDKKRHLFVSYAREDVQRVKPLVDAVREELALRALPVDIWMDISELSPGQQWAIAISEALNASVGFLFFLSPLSLRSDWVRREVEVAARASGRLIIPVILDEPLNVPFLLAEWQWLRYTGLPSRQETADAASRIADAVERFLRATPQPETAIAPTEASVVAADIAKDVRASINAAPPQGPPRAVFVVHGHDALLVEELERFLDLIGIEPVILSRLDEQAQSLFQKFMTIASRARFAIVLLGADDYGASREQYDAPQVADRALQFRARQNVILELGFFYGKLGWENVFVVHQAPDKVFPNFERPSDLDGVAFDSVKDRSWKRKLAGRLADAGFELRDQHNAGKESAAAADNSSTVV